MTRQRCYYDTFDWRLYRNGYVLETDAEGSLLGRLRTLGARGDQITTSLQAEPDFARNYGQDTELREYLGQYIAMRRLLCQAQIRVSSEPYAVMDQGGKVLLRLELEKFQRPDRRGHLRTALVNCRFQPLTGYQKICQRLLELANAESGPDVSGDPFLWLLAMERKQPGGYSSKFNLVFTPELNIAQVLAQTLLFHLNVLDNNVAGICADLDTEFLHDFRIANRRSRTLVTQIKQVLPPLQDRQYKDIFSWLSNETSEHRDLDVFLLDIPRHQTMLPGRMRGGLEPLRLNLEEKRRKIHERVVKVINSEKFRLFAAGYRTYLNRGSRNHFQTSTGAKPVLAVANQAIWRVYEKMLKQGRQASQSGDRDTLHALRKTAKKLRYLLETFRSLYPREDMDAVIMHCRKLQNILGQIVDSRVQQDYLHGLTGVADPAEALPPATLACIHYLIGAYQVLEIKAYAKFSGRYERFAEAGTRALFKKLFLAAG